MSRLLLPTDKCSWCWAPGAYRTCYHDTPPVGCPVHGKYTDLNLIARGRRAVVKCAHYGNACVVMYADPIGDNKEVGSYTLEFFMLGTGRELYTIPPGRHICPHKAYDQLVQDMRSGATPHPNRVPPAQDEVVEPGESLDARES